jgi:hypothetical protein
LQREFEAANSNSGGSMMSSRSLTVTVLLIAGSVGAIPARAQNANAIEQVMVNVSMQTTRLDAALENLGAIGKNLHGADAGRVGQVTNAGRQFTGVVGEAAPVSLILRHMTAPEDIRFTRAMLAISASKAMLVADSDAQIINRYLPHIATPQAVAESIKVRDAILETRNLLAVVAQVPQS